MAVNDLKLQVRVVTKMHPNHRKIFRQLSIFEHGNLLNPESFVDTVGIPTEQARRLGQPSASQAMAEGPWSGEDCTGARFTIAQPQKIQDPDPGRQEYSRKPCRSRESSAGFAITPARRSASAEKPAMPFPSGRLNAPALSAHPAWRTEFRSCPAKTGAPP